MIREKREMLLRNNSNSGDIEIDKDLIIKNQQMENDFEVNDITKDSEEKR